MLTPIESVAWLFITLYHEARSEPISGIVEVGHVILNRSERRQKTIKQIVLASKQFSCFNRGTEQPISETAGIVKTAAAMFQLFLSRLSGKYTSADHYHRYDVNPYWDDEMSYLGQIGDHQFFDSRNRRGS